VRSFPALNSLFKGFLAALKKPRDQIVMDVITGRTLIPWRPPYLRSLSCKTLELATLQ
jgi:hypothetical protein